MVNIANEFHRGSKLCRIVLLAGEGDYFQDVERGVAIDSLGYSGWLSLPGVGLRYLRYLRANRPSAVVVSGHLAFLVALVGRLLSAARLVVVAHNTVSQEVRLSRHIPRFLYRFADRLVAVSRGVADDLSAFGGIRRDRITVIYNPVDLDSLTTKTAAPIPHPWLGSGEVPVVIGVGSLTRQKRFDILIESISLVRKRVRVRLLILGEGPLRASLEERIHELGIGEDTELLGFVENPYAYMTNASVLALSSDFEGFGLVILEALACGCPVVSTDCPSGPREILEEGRWGSLVPCGDAPALGQALESAIDCSLDRRSQLKQRAKQFALPSCADQYLRLLREIVG